MLNRSLSSLPVSHRSHQVQYHLLILAPSDANISQIVAFLASSSLFTYHLVLTTDHHSIYYTENKYDGVLLCQYPLISTEAWLKILSSLPRNIPLILISNAPTITQILETDCLSSIITDYLVINRLFELPVILQRSLLRFEQQKQVKYHQILQQIINKMAENLPLDQILQATVNLLYDALEVSRCFLLRPGNNDDLIIKYSAHQTPNSSQFLGAKCPIYNYYKPLLTKEQPFAFSEIDQHSPQPLQEFARKNNVYSLMIMPLFYQQGFLGAICLQHCQHSHPWTEAEKELVKTIARQCSLAIHQAELEQAIQHYQNLEQHYQKRTQELELEKQQSQQANQAKTDFLSHMTHELRTPMTGILGFSKMLMQQIYGSLNDKQMEYIKGIYDSGQHLLELINDLLDISKIEAEREELFLETIGVEDVCLASLSMVQPRARQSNLALNLEIDPELNFCVADERRLKQILVNLLSNAIKFTENGSVTLKVTKDNQMILFSVIDTGIGISDTDQEKLFQPFTQIRNHLSNKQKGTGLGLALSLKLARLHSGDLTFASEAGKGSCFTLKIPL